MAKARQDYYLKKLGELSPREDYYLRGGRATGWWRGSGAADLGLEGKVSTQALVRLFEGQDPRTGEQLGVRLREDGVGAWDLTFSADKSVSLLWAFGDSEIRREVRRAFDEATAEALSYLESVASSTRGGRRVPVLDETGNPVVGADGKARTRTETWSIPTTGFVAASFTEFTSRADDPQLHTHVVAGNKVKAVDGKWRAIDGKLILRHKMAAGAIHEAELRSRLTQYLGVRWQPIERGLADIEGFTRKQVDSFSQRRKQVDEWRDAHELADTAANSARAALATRPAKQERPFGELVIEWIQRGEQVGLTDETVERVVGRSREITEPDVPKLIAELVSPEGLTSRKSTFGKPEVVCAIAAALPEGGTRQQVEELVGQLLEHPEIVHLPAAGKEQRYTTTELLAIEQAMIHRAVDGIGAGRWTAPESLVEASFAQWPHLTTGQKDLIHQAATSGDAISVAVGKAGTGKSSALAVVADLAAATDTPIIGTALAAKAATGLESETGIASRTITKLLAQADQRPLPAGSIVVVDEAGMVGTRTLARIADHVEAVGGKLVLVGDHKQLAELEAGGLFRALSERLPAVELTENVRQAEAWERTALAELRDGDTDRALDLYRENRRVTRTHCHEEAVELAVGAWSRDVSELGDPSQVLLIAYQNTTVELANQQARKAIAAAGHLTGEALTTDDRTLQQGDRVLCRRNRGDIGVLNGDLATITKVDKQRGRITIRLDRDEQTRTIPTWYLQGGHVDYGYAITGHKAQGATTQRSHVVAEPGAEREWVYVAMSRGQQANNLYYPDPDTLEPENCTHITHRRPAGVDTFGQSLQRERTQRAALDMGGISR